MSTSDLPQLTETSPPWEFYFCLPQPRQFSEICVYACTLSVYMKSLLTLTEVAPNSLLCVCPITDGSMCVHRLSQPQGLETHTGHLLVQGTATRWVLVPEFKRCSRYLPLLFASSLGGGCFEGKVSSKKKMKRSRNIFGNISWKKSKHFT